MGPSFHLSISIIHKLFFINVNLSVYRPTNAFVKAIIKIKINDVLRDLWHKAAWPISELGELIHFPNFVNNPASEELFNISVTNSQD